PSAAWPTAWRWWRPAASSTTGRRSRSPGGCSRCTPGCCSAGPRPGWPSPAACWARSARALCSSWPAGAGWPPGPPAGSSPRAPPPGRAAGLAVPVYRADLHRRPVGADLLAGLELAGVEAHREHRVRAPGLRRLDQAVLRVDPALGEHLGHPLQLAADQGLEARAELGAHVPGPHGDAEHLSQDLGHLVPGQVVHGTEDHVAILSPVAALACRDPPPAGTYPGAVVLAPEGRRLLRLEARNSQTPIERKPPWIKTRLRTGPEYTELK